jgi:exodeoxyribonuclease VII small subunit
MKESKDTGTSSKSYAELSAELESILATLRNDDVDVDDAVEAFKQGMKLVAALEKHLNEAENTVRKIASDFSG